MFGVLCWGGVWTIGRGIPGKSDQSYDLPIDQQKSVYSEVKNGKQKRWNDNFASSNEYSKTFKESTTVLRSLFPGQALNLYQRWKKLGENQMSAFCCCCCVTWNCFLLLLQFKMGAISVTWNGLMILNPYHTWKVKSNLWNRSKLKIAVLHFLVPPV